MSDDPLDLSAKLPSGHNYTATIAKDETPAEIKVRLFKDVATFTLVALFVLALGVICFLIVRDPNAGPDDKKWAMSFLTGVSAGVTGYLLKR